MSFWSAIYENTRKDRTAGGKGALDDKVLDHGVQLVVGGRGEEVLHGRVGPQRLQDVVDAQILEFGQLVATARDSRPRKVSDSSYAPNRTGENEPGNVVDAQRAGGWRRRRRMGVWVDDGQAQSRMTVRARRSGLVGRSGVQGWRPVRGQDGNRRGPRLRRGLSVRARGRPMSGVGRGRGPELGSGSRTQAGLRDREQWLRFSG